MHFSDQMQDRINHFWLSELVWRKNNIQIYKAAILLVEKGLTICYKCQSYSHITANCFLSSSYFICLFMFPFSCTHLPNFGNIVPPHLTQCANALPDTFSLKTNPHVRAVPNALLDRVPLSALNYTYF